MIRPEYNKSLFPRWCEMPIRYRDLDTLEHVNNALYGTYYEEARIRFIQEEPVFLEQIEQGFGFVLANLTIDFIVPAEYPADLLIGSGIKKLGNTSITTFQAIYHAAQKNLLSVAETAGVWFDLENRRPARIPDTGKMTDFMIDQRLFE